MQPRSTVIELIRAHAPGLTPDELRDDELVLGADGLGLDSIAIAELVLACEVHFAVPLAHLLEAGPLTVGRLVGSLNDASVAR